MYDTGRQAAGMKGSKAIMEEKKNLLTYAGLHVMGGSKLYDENASTGNFGIADEKYEKRFI